MTVEELRVLYSFQELPDAVFLVSTSIALTSSAIEGVYTCRGINQFGESSSNISIFVQSMLNTDNFTYAPSSNFSHILNKTCITSVGGEGDSSSVYVRFSTILSLLYQGMDLAALEYIVRLAVVLHDVVCTVT